MYYLSPARTCVTRCISTLLQFTPCSSHQQPTRFTINTMTIDINRTIGNFFTIASKDIFNFSRRFRRIAKRTNTKKSFLFSARISNLTSDSIWQNKNIELSLAFCVGNQIVPWLVVKQSTIPGAGKGTFLLQPGKKGEVITCFMGIKKPAKYGSNYAFGNIDPCDRNQKSQSFHYCFAHLVNHGSGNKANVYVDYRGRLILLRDVAAGEELFFDYNRDAKCNVCKIVMKRNQQNRKCSIRKCKKRSIIINCKTCDYGLCRAHYDRHQIKER